MITHEGTRLGIVELVEVCARERARALALFQHLGTWVATTADPTLQRLFATAAHRHAWHAQLWADRSPTIAVPHVVADVAAIVEAGDDADRWTAYVTSLGTLIVDLGGLSRSDRPRPRPEHRPRDRNSSGPTRTASPIWSPPRHPPDIGVVSGGWRSCAPRGVASRGARRCRAAASGRRGCMPTTRTG